MEGVIVHRPRDHQAIVPVRRFGIATTDPIRTLGDLGQVVYSGWTVDRFTWTHATTQMPWLLETIRSRLIERGWSAT